jgi:hypothetical protein
METYSTDGNKITQKQEQPPGKRSDVEKSCCSCHQSYKKGACHLCHLGKIQQIQGHICKMNKLGNPRVILYEKAYSFTKKPYSKGILNPFLCTELLKAVRPSEPPHLFRAFYKMSDYIPDDSDSVD